jgi:phosphoserine aminotransferase
MYQAIDRHPLLESWVDAKHRSLVNACFRGKSPEVEQKLLSYLVEFGVMGIQGFPTKGGLRASMYNGMPIEDVDLLVELLEKFDV